MSLDVYLSYEEDGQEISVYSANITHNLVRMADAAGIYEACWRPEEKGWMHARDIIPTVEEGLKRLKEQPDYFKQFNAANGWGLYEHFVPWVERYLDALKKYPSATISVSR